MRAAAATLGRLPRAVAVLPRAVVPGRHGRRRLMALALLVIALAAAYTFWFRDSSFVRVERVTVTGIDSVDGARVRAKLTVVAKRMTTLNVDAGALRRVVAGDPVVHSISIRAEFPHTLKIEVVQNRAVALLVTPSGEVAVAPDGTLLPGTESTAGLPSVRVASVPSGRIPQGAALDKVAVAAAVPSRLRPRVESISIQHGRGAVAELQHGPIVIFGQPVELEHKWAAAAAVLADRSSEGATYIDVRMPRRPVAGGLSLQDDPQTPSQGLVPAAPPPGPGPVGQPVPTPQPASVPPAASSAATPPVSAAPAGATQAASPPEQVQP